VRPTSPRRIVSMVSHAEAYASGARLAHPSAASVARSSTPALPDSVRRNERNGADRLETTASCPKRYWARGGFRSEHPLKVGQRDRAALRRPVVNNVSSSSGVARTGSADAFTSASFSGRPT
jgi:hypothetical protein